ncbi:unnamed protein product [Agarophyton chilense]|eukprot:gb/GEZJ01003714.1/.p1 GENE.gb/GEZJ01003714.1/~~gb/GEZJ01003714.1/.p1  ORF type:complete len:353 (-),score=22.57 gb/GEZJ01003714.1/:1509-2567(-)
MSYSTAVSDISSVDGDREPRFKSLSQSQSQSREGKGHGTDASYYTPRKGSLYHMDATCPMLVLKKMGRVHHSVPKGFEPCVLCETHVNTRSTFSDSSPASKEAKDTETPSKEVDQKPKPRTWLEKAQALSFGTKKQDSQADEKDNASPTRVTSTACSRPVSTRDVEYVTTRTGRFYHQDPQCHNLRSAKKKIFVTRVRADLEACYLCVDDDAPIDTPTEVKSAGSTTERSITATNLSKPLITTRTGRFYHSDSSCKNLRFAKKKIPVYEVPTNLEACYLCVESPLGSQTASEGASRGVAGGTSSTPECGRYITTRTGRFYHLDYDCYNLRSAKAKFRKQTAPDGLLPCYKCA